MDNQLRNWNMGRMDFYSPGFYEWLKYKARRPSAFRTIADQPYRIAREFDYLLDKYGETDGNGAALVHEQARAEFLRNIQGI